MTKGCIHGMRPEQVADLLDTFPALYRHIILGLDGNDHEILFSCGHGRFQLVYQLSQDIEVAAREMGLDPRSRHWPMVLRVADVDGKLQFNMVTDGGENLSVCALYLAGAERPSLAPRFQKLVDDAESKSSMICDSCGQPGTFRGAHTSCDWCAGERARLQSEEEEILADGLGDD